MKNIYCISGLGADEKAFARLRVDGYQFIHLPWLMPEPNENIEQYATRMAALVTDEHPVLMGLSFGGIMSIEIAKLVQAEKVIPDIQRKILRRDTHLDEGRRKDEIEQDYSY